MALLSAACEREIDPAAESGSLTGVERAEVGGDTPKRGQSPFDDIVPPPVPTHIGAPKLIPAGDRPNLVIVSIDTLRADRVGAYGHARPTTPRIDQLAAEGVLFENAFSHAPTTAPSHMTLFTGLYPEAHRVRNMFNGEKRLSDRWLGPGIPTLAGILRDAGYTTVARTAGGNLGGTSGFARGFDSFVGISGRDVTDEFRAASQELSRLAGEFEPFFLFVHTYEVHAPYLPPKRYRDQFVDPDYRGRIIGDSGKLARVSKGGYTQRHRAFWDRVDRESPADMNHLLDLYDAGVRYTDDALGMLLDRIDASGVGDRTIVVVLSDHGEEFGEHGGFEHQALWRELLQVPLVMRVPEAIRTGWSERRVSEVVGLVDVLPTLLELLSIPAPSHLHGRSLVPRIEGDGSGPAWVFAQHHRTQGTALVTKDWKWLNVRAGTEPMLFDRNSDPDEFMDQAGEKREWRRRGAVKVRGILAASRAVWPLAGEGERIAPTAEMREELEALGYVTDPTEEAVAEPR